MVRLKNVLKIAKILEPNKALREKAPSTSDLGQHLASCDNSISTEHVGTNTVLLNLWSSRSM